MNSEISDFIVMSVPFCYCAQTFHWIALDLLLRSTALAIFLEPFFPRHNEAASTLFVLYNATFYPLHHSSYHIPFIFLFTQSLLFILFSTFLTTFFPSMSRLDTDCSLIPSFVNLFDTSEFKWKYTSLERRVNVLLKWVREAAVADAKNMLNDIA